MPAMDALEAMQKYEAFGPDFLTWLFLRAREGEAAFGAKFPWQVAFRGPLTFEGVGGEATKIALSGDEAADAAEAVSALREGKKLVKAKVVLSDSIDEFVFTINAHTFDLTGVKVPTPKLPDMDQYLSDRIVALQRLYDTIGELYERHFLPKRLSAKDWKKEVKGWRTLAKE